MQWTDQAIILSTSKYSEQAAIASCFAREHGMYRAMAKRAFSKAQRGLYQSGNIVEATWKARLAEHMGQLTAEMVMPVAAHAMQTPEMLYGVSSMCRLIECCFEERDPHPLLFDMMQETLTRMIEEKPWIGQYAAFEKQLLTDSGYQLDVTHCAATGATDHLIYVSPKSGRAVSAEAGEAYKDKLFRLPPQFDDRQWIAEGLRDQQDSLRMTGYFLDKWVLNPHGQTLPNARRQLLARLFSS